MIRKTEKSSHGSLFSGSGTEELKIYRTGFHAKLNLFFSKA